MTNIIIGEYIKNIWYNIITVLIIVATLIISTIYISNINTQTKLYRLVSQYLNEDSLLMFRKSGFDDESLDKVEDSIMTKEIICFSNDVPNLDRFVVYDDEIMNSLKPRLTKGRYISEKEGGEIEVLASNSGFKVGDVVSVIMFDNKTGAEIEVRLKVVGIIADGQKIFAYNGSLKPNEMTYKDMYLTYSYKQLNESVFITTEEQLSKIGEEVVISNFWCIYKLNEDISDIEKFENQMKITNYEMEQMDTPTSSIFPSSDTLTERMNKDVENIVLKYVPLTIGIIIMVIVCVTGIVSIKTVKSMRYYAIMHMCGMKRGTTIGLSGMEMLINCIFAIMLAVSLIIIQNYHNIIGTINCELGFIQILIMMTISMLIIITTMLVTNASIKECTTIEILKDTTY